MRPAGLGADVEVLLLDLDGVLWRGTEVLRAAVDVARRARDAGVELRCVTNNASRTPQEVAERLERAGLALPGDAVVTSATAAAAVLAERCDPGDRVLVCGAPALRAAVSERGLALTEEPGDADAVVSGWSDALDFEVQARAALAVRAGARWVATNTDATLPSERGPLPGAGAFVALLATAAGVSGPAEVAGKPGPRLHLTALGDHDPGAGLAVGDRLETDVVAARRAGVRAVAVLSGVATLRDVLAARGEERPDDVGVDLTLLDSDRARDVPGDDPVPDGEDSADEISVGGAHAVRVDDGSVELRWEGGDGPSHDAARALLLLGVHGSGAPVVRLGAGAEVLRTTLPGLEELLDAGDTRQRVR